MNKSWNYKKIGDVCIVERGGSPRPIDKFITEDKEGINWIKIGDTSDSMYITETAQKIIPEGMKKSRYVEHGDFLLSNSMSFGRPYILKIDGCIHDGWLVLRDKDNIFDKRFLYYYLSSKTTYEKFKQMAVGGVVNNLNSEMVRGVTVPVIDKEEQRKIADILDKVSEIIASRKKEIEEFDNIIKSRFVELFGDPIYNPMKWATDAVENLCSEIYGGGTPSKAHPEYYEEGDIPWVSSKDMKMDVLYDSQIKINQLGVENSTAKMVPINSVIMVIRSGILKHTLPVAINAVPITVNQDLKVFIPNDRMLSLFLMFQFKMIEKDILSGVRAVTADNIEFNSLKERKIIVPPIELQGKFVSFVEQIDKLKVEVQKSLDETQQLMDSLMQKYFG